MARITDWTLTSTFAADDHIALDGLTNGSRRMHKDSLRTALGIGTADTPTFGGLTLTGAFSAATAVISGSATVGSLSTAGNITADTATNLTLAGGSSGASLVLGQGTSGAGTISVTGTSGAAASALTLRTSFATTSSATRLAFDNATNANLGIVEGGTENGSTSGYLAIRTRSGGATNEVTRATSSQNFLIGGTTDIAGSGGLKVFGTTASTSTTTGALQVAGGVGVAGAGNFGGPVTVSGNIGYTNASSGILDYSSPATRIISRGPNGSTDGNISLITTRGDGSNSTLAVSITATATTLAGNLTVSGTGTSTFGGSLSLANNAILTVGTGVSTTSMIVLDGSRPVTLRSSTGQVEVKASSGGWDGIGLEFQGSAGTTGGAIFGEGSSDALSTMYWGYGATPSSDKRVIVGSGNTIVRAALGGTVQLHGGDGGTGTTGVEFYTHNGIGQNTRIRGDGGLTIRGTSTVTGIRTATATYDFGTIGAGSQVGTTVTVTGAAAGDAVTINTTDGSRWADGVIVQANVTSANTVSVNIFNPGASGNAVGSRSFRVTVISF